MHAAYRKLQSISERSGLDTAELSLRWLVHHSALTDGDLIILGASKIHQVEPSLEKLEKGPLEADVAGELTSLWDESLQAIGEDNVGLYSRTARG